MVLTVLCVAFLGLVAYAVFTDLREMIIPNWLNATLPVLFIPAALAAGLDWATVGWHVLTGAIALVVCFGLFAFRIFGGGDAKMIPGVVMWLGPSAMYGFSVSMTIMGGILALVLILTKRFVPADSNIIILQKQSGVPYAVAIAVGVVMSMQYSPILAPGIGEYAVQIGLMR